MSRAVRFKLIFYVPPAALESYKAAVFATGAGIYPGYTECAFTSKGTGQFRPSKTAKSHIGKIGLGEFVEEMRVETICTGRDGAVKAVEALKKAHPYEEAAYEVFELEGI